MKVFLSYSFSGEDNDLAHNVERLFASHNILMAKGRRLGGGQLTAEVQRRIDSSDALVALMTRQEQVGDPAAGRWLSSAWIEYELIRARDQGLPAIAIVEPGVRTDGPLQGFERIPFDRAHPLEAFLALSETLHLWREQLGILRTVQIRPDDIGHVVRTNRDLQVRYRLISRGIRGDWVDVEPVLQPSGTILYVKGVPSDDTLIEVEIMQDDKPRWFSRATSQFISVEMQAWGNGQ